MIGLWTVVCFGQSIEGRWCEEPCALVVKASFAHCKKDSIASRISTPAHVEAPICPPGNTPVKITKGLISYDQNMSGYNSSAGGYGRDMNGYNFREQCVAFLYHHPITAEFLLYMAYVSKVVALAGLAVLLIYSLLTNNSKPASVRRSLGSYFKLPRCPSCGKILLAGRGACMDALHSTPGKFHWHGL